MANGGFGYASAAVTYHAADFGTYYAWAYALHKARVTAFLQASYKAGEISPDEPFSGAWTSIRLSDDSSLEENEEYIEYDPAGHPGDTHAVYIQSVHGSLELSYPAFVTVFENPSTYTQYAIVTAKGYHNVSANASDPTKGLYIPVEKCLGNGNYRLLPYAFAHAFGANGIDSIRTGLGEIGVGSLRARELPLCPSYGNPAYANTSNISSASQQSILTNAIEGVSYQFGYAIKGVVIEGFFKNSSFPNGAGAFWDVSGAIFAGDDGWDDDTTTFSGTVFGYYSAIIAKRDYEARSLSDNFSFAGSSRSNTDCTTDDDGLSYSQKLLQSGQSVSCYPACSPGYITMRSDSTIGAKLVWSSGCVAWSVNAGYNEVRNLPSIDGQGNSVKGFLRDDVFRFVSIFATRIGGTTFQGGNFIGMNCGQQAGGFELGVLLGWDNSNTNDIL